MAMHECRSQFHELYLRSKPLTRTFDKRIVFVFMVGDREATRDDTLGTDAVDLVMSHVTSAFYFSSRCVRVRDVSLEMTFTIYRTWYILCNNSIDVISVYKNNSLL